MEFQLKLTHHTKNQEDVKLNEERQLVDANAKTKQMLELFDKDFKANITKML